MARRQPTIDDCRRYHAARYELKATEYCREKNLTYTAFSTMYAQWKRENGYE